MSEYCLSVVIVSALVSFAELISYSAGKERGEKIAISVITLYLIISPVAVLARGGFEFDFSSLSGDYEETGEGLYLELGEEAFCEGIKKLLLEKWGVEKSECAVAVSGFDFENMRAELIMINLLSGAFTADFREIESYIEKAGLGECEVTYAHKGN